MRNTRDEAIVSPYLVLAIGILAVSTASIFIRYAQEEAPSLAIGAYRLLFAALILAPFAIKKNIREIRNVEKRKFSLMMLAGIFLAFHFATWITSLEYTTVASSVVLVTTAPLWVAIFSPIFLKEKITRIVSLGSLCDFSRSTITCESIGNISNGKTLLGDFLALTGAFLSAGYLIIGRKVRKDTSLLTYTFVVYAVAGLCMSVLMLFSKVSFVGYSPTAYLLFFALAVIPQLLGHSSFNYALRYKSSALVSVALLGEPIGSVILAFLLLKEIPAAAEIAGGAFILIGIYLVSRSNDG
jgi:drug/metabolite transporter (DMT)-like permease